MNTHYRYVVSEHLLDITHTEKIEHLASRKYLGEPLAEDIRRWLRSQPAYQPLYIDFVGIQTMNGSVAQEVGPFVMEAVAQSSVFEHRYPIFSFDNVDIADTLALTLAQLNVNALGRIKVQDVSSPVMTPISHFEHALIVVLGIFTQQNRQILELAVEQAEKGKALTSDQLGRLDFLAHVSAAARSKRLTELYTRRLLAFRENPQNYKKRIFLPPWLLEERNYDRCSITSQVF
jgi:hypothetical protein